MSNNGHTIFVSAINTTRAAWWSPNEITGASVYSVKILKLLHGKSHVLAFTTFSSLIIFHH